MFGLMINMLTMLLHCFYSWMAVETCSYQTLVFAQSINTTVRKGCWLRFVVVRRMQRLRWVRPFFLDAEPLAPFDFGSGSFVLLVSWLSEDLTMGLRSTCGHLASYSLSSWLEVSRSPFKSNIYLLICLSCFWSSSPITYIISDTPWDTPTMESLEFSDYVNGTIWQTDPWTRISPEAKCTCFASPFPPSLHLEDPGLYQIASRSGESIWRPNTLHNTSHNTLILVP